MGRSRLLARPAWVDGSVRFHGTERGPASPGSRRGGDPPSSTAAGRCHSHCFPTGCRVRGALVSGVCGGGEGLPCGAGWARRPRLLCVLHPARGGCPPIERGRWVGRRHGCGDSVVLRPFDARVSRRYRSAGLAATGREATVYPRFPPVATGVQQRCVSTYRIRGSDRRREVCLGQVPPTVRSTSGGIVPGALRDRG